VPAAVFRCIAHAMYVPIVPADYALATLLPLHTYFGKYESVWLKLMPLVGFQLGAFYHEYSGNL